ncbi:MAG TPA: hypothetical protein VLF62_06110 [Candidatus Saccharimonadales bacterium]|nr:hypothetical protein [Candidatus Saccharimonadales bacterium]
MPPHTSPESAMPAPDFRGRIDAITGRSLSAGNINTYAEDALNDLIGVVREASGLYQEQTGAGALKGAEGERAALQHAGLDGNEIETSLGRISDVAQEIAELDDLIARVTVHSGRVITPPKDDELRTLEQAPEKHGRRTVPRVKTLLFILSNRYELNLADAADCRIIDGAAPDSIVRRHSYNLVITPSLNRSILVCDEVGNATFVFDTARLEAAGIDEEALQGLDKPSLKQLLDSEPGLGYRLEYSDTFTEEIGGLLEAIPVGEPIIAHESSAQFLSGAHMPEGMARRGKVARELGVTYNRIDQAVEALDGQLGEVQSFQGWPIYTEAQREQIRTWLQDKGFYAEKAQEGQRSVNRMRQELSVGDDAIHEAIAALGDEFGAPQRAKVGLTYAPVYSAGQQDKIRAWLIANNRIKTDEQAGHLTASQIADIVGISGMTMRSLIAANAEGIGEPEAVGRNKEYSPAQQGVIMNILDRGGYLAEKAPEGAVSLRNLATALGYSRRATAAAAESGVAGEPGRYMIGARNARPGHAYTVEQQEIMRQWLAENGYVQTQAAIGATASGESVQVEAADTEGSPGRPAN